MPRDSKNITEGSLLVISEFEGLFISIQTSTTCSTPPFSRTTRSPWPGIISLLMQVLELHLRPFFFSHQDCEIFPILFHEINLNYHPIYRDEEYWQKPLEYKSKDFKLMVKRVFITSDIGDEGLPKWASWVKVVVDGAAAP